MTLDINLKTGDETYKTRVERFQYVQNRLAEKPRPTLATIAKELGISRQNVHRLIKRGTVKPAGRPPTNEGRKARLVKRLGTWQSRRLDKLAKGRPTDFEDQWIAKVEALLKALD